MISHTRRRDVTVLLGLIFSNKKTQDDGQSGNRDIAKLFFDSFSKRVETVEHNLQNMSAQFDKLKLTIERGQISDLVLLDRLQKAENMIRESLDSIRTAVEEAYQLAGEMPAPPSAQQSEPLGPRLVEVPTLSRAAITAHILSPTGELGSLPSITTPTELQVLTLLAGEGPKSAPEIGRAVGRSREHTARLMKKLFEEGYIRRDQTRIPFRYSVVDRLKQTVKKTESKDEEGEQVSVPQT